MRWREIWNESDRPNGGSSQRSMRWVEMSIEATDASMDAVANILTEEGAGGAVFGPTIQSADAKPTRVTGYLPVDDRLEARLDSIRTRVSSLPALGLPLESDDVTVKWVEDEEWATAWKKHFKPIKVGRIIVKPTWEPCDAGPGDITIEIDPGMAFGTGYHPTTQLCLLALQERVRGGELVLDVGTGSGILAIAASKLGAGSVVGLDVDSVAVEVAQENVNYAGLADVVSIARADSPLAFDGQADVVIANILAQVLIDMVTEIAQKVTPGGLVISSGIIAERAADVRASFEAHGLDTVEEKRDGDWVLIVSRRAR